MHPAVELLRHLPIGERLQIVNELWDDMDFSQEEAPLSESDVQEARRRLDELIAHPEIALTREQIWQRVRRQDG